MKEHIQSKYDQKVVEEINCYREVENVHELPEIFHYWSNKYLVPMFSAFGFHNPTEFFLTFIHEAETRKNTDEDIRIVSLGAGNCEFEVEIASHLKKSRDVSFTMECVDINPHMLQRGKMEADRKGVHDKIKFTNMDILEWTPINPFDVIIANQSLHHFQELEKIFRKIHLCLSDEGFFLTHDMIGRNGHMRWPEVLVIINDIWNDLPDRYKFNHQLKRMEKQYNNWDCSNEGFEGIRSQDILPLLAGIFNFELFVAWGGLIDIFIERSFGHNFDPEKEWDKEFIDDLHEMNVKYIRDGRIKPTQMIAAMAKHPVANPRVIEHLTPQFCIRNIG